MGGWPDYFAGYVYLRSSVLRRLLRHFGLPGPHNLRNQLRHCALPDERKFRQSRGYLLWLSCCVWWLDYSHRYRYRQSKLRNPRIKHNWRTRFCKRFNHTFVQHDLWLIYRQWIQSKSFRRYGLDDRNSLDHWGYSL